MTPLPEPDWPALWSGKADFCVLDTGGETQAAPAELSAEDQAGHETLGLTGFLRLWNRWRRDPGRRTRLHVLLLFEGAAQCAAAWRQAATAAVGLDADLLPQLQAVWPPLTPNLHPLDLDGGRVQLTLGLGPLPKLLPRLRLHADVVYLAGAAALGPVPAAALPTTPHPAQRLRMLKAVARLSTAGALAWGARSSPALLAELRTAGFHQQHPHPAGQVWARYEPHARSQRWAAWPPAMQAPAVSAATPPRTALVIGAGVAGAAAAQALVLQGLAVTVLDRHARPAAETSGNPAALFHGTVNPDDGLYARLFRAAALVAQRSYSDCRPGAVGRLGADEADGAQPRQWATPLAGTVAGLLRMQPAGAPGQSSEEVLQHMRAQLRRLGLPPDYVQALDAAEASARAGRPLAAPAWFYPGGGWIDPARWVQQVLQGPGVEFSGTSAVQALRYHGGQWQALNDQGRVLAQAEVLVLACAIDSQRLLAGLDAAGLSSPEPQPQPGAPAIERSALQWPLRQTRGQVTLLTRAGPAREVAALGPVLRVPVAGDGYALALAEPGVLLCGATRQAVPLQDRPGPQALQPMASGQSNSDEGRLPSEADQQLNLQRLQRLTGLQPQADSALLGRVGWRMHTDDRLPIAGPVPMLKTAACADRMTVGQPSAGLQTVRVDQARQWPRWPGLFVLTALGARGLTLAPLLGRLVAAQATGTPWPVEQELADAVDPVRWALRAARHKQAGPESPSSRPQTPRQAPVPTDPAAQVAGAAQMQQQQRLQPRPQARAGSGPAQNPGQEEG